MLSQFRIDCKECGGPLNFQRKIADNAHNYRCEAGHSRLVYLNSEGGLVTTDEPSLLKVLALSVADAIGKSRK